MARARTTFNIDADLYRRIKQRAAAESVPVTTLVEQALTDLLLRSTARSPEPLDLPAVGGGAPRVDVADRRALAQLLDDPAYWSQFGQ